MALKALSFEGLTYYHNKIKTLLSGKVDKEDGKGLSSNDYTTAEKTKLAGIETGADANVIETVQVNGSALSVTDKKVNVDLSAYALKSDISAVYRFKGNVATYADLPNVDQTVGDVYNVEEDGGNYAWTGEGWDDLAGVVDLTEYYTKSEADGKFVDVTGDTMTGNLTISSTAPRMHVSNSAVAVGDEVTDNQFLGVYYIYDKNGVGAQVGSRMLTNGIRRLNLSQIGKDGTSQSQISAVVEADGTAYGIAPTPSNNADNSDKIATTAWVNLASSVVHTTGNETISGTKEFTGGLVQSGKFATTNIRNTDLVKSEIPSEVRYSRVQFQDSNNATVGAIGCWSDTHGLRRSSLRVYKDSSDPNASKYGDAMIEAVYDINNDTFYATAPATRETGYVSNEIATCGWVETKIATGGGEAITNDEIDSIFA